MLKPDNREFEAVAIADACDVSMGGLLDFLSVHKEKPLVFIYDGKAVKPGYHVTEVKAGQFSALDCGANPEAWTEIFVQLWDVAGDQAHMPVAKFSAIVRKVSEHVGLDQSAKLTFEVSDGVRPMQLYRAGQPRIVDGAVHVELIARPASCKPRDRWLERQADRSACCATSGKAQACCGK